MKGFIEFILVLLIVALLVGVIAVIYQFTNGFNEDFKTFYVEYDGEKYLSSNSTLDLQETKEYRFDVKYTFDNTQSTVKDYFVKIVPNVTEDFEFTVGDETHSYKEVKDLSSVFHLNKEQTSFTFTAGKSYSIENVLTILYEGKRVTVPASASKNTTPYKVVVSSYNKKVVLEIGLNIANEDTDTPIEEHTIRFQSFDWGNTSCVKSDGPNSAAYGELVKISIRLSDWGNRVTDKREVSVVTTSGKSVEFWEDGYNYTFIMPNEGVLMTVRLAEDDTSEPVAPDYIGTFLAGYSLNGEQRQCTLVATENSIELPGFWAEGTQFEYKAMSVTANISDWMTGTTYSQSYIDKLYYGYAAAAGQTLNTSGTPIMMVFYYSKDNAWHLIRQPNTQPSLVFVKTGGV